MGVLIVFASLKMRANRREMLQLEEVGRSFFRQRASNRSHRPEEGRRLSPGGDSAARIVSPSAEQPVEAAPDGQQETRLDSSSPAAAADAASESKRSSLGLQSSEAPGEAPDDPTGGGGSEQLPTGAGWLPDADLNSYGNDHQAAIETALSTVLTAATLAGFRPNHQLHSFQDSAGQSHCCLHHAVQVSLGRLWSSA